MKIQNFGITLLLMAIAAVVIVSALPPSPAGFFGTLKINGNPAQVGAAISAWINGVHYPTDSSVYGSDGSYKILSVNGDDPETESIEGGKSGDAVMFKVTINGKKFVADQTGVWNSGVNQKLDLTLTLIPTSRTITLKKGWNLISVPLDTT